MPQENEPNRVEGLYAYLAISSLINLATWVLLLLPSFLQQRGWTGQGIGWAVGAYFSMNLVSQILAGQFADRYGSIRTALVGVALGLVAGGFYVASPSLPWVVIPARIFHGAGTGMITSGALIQLTRTVPIHRKGQIMGYFGLPGFVMIGVGPLISEYLVYGWGFAASFVVVLLSFALAGVLLLRLPRSLVTSSLPRRSFLVSLKTSFVRLKAILTFSVFFGFCFSSWNGFLAPTVAALGAGAVSSFGSGYAIGAVLSRLGLSHRLDSHSRRLLAISSLFPYAFCLALIPFAAANWHLLLIGVVTGMGHGICYPSLSSLAAERFHPLYPGQGMSLYISASGLGLFLGPPLWGALADQFGYTVIFAAAGVLLASATGVFVRRENRAKNEAA
jgi:MFS family permease